MKLILCIDDQPDRYDELVSLCSRIGVLVVVADRPEHVRHYLERHTEGVELVGILLDHDMPIRAGTEFVEDIANHRDETTVIAVSGNVVGRERLVWELKDRPWMCWFEIPVTEFECEKRWLRALDIEIPEPRAGEIPA